MRGYPQFSFWISITLVKICFSRIFSKSRKNTFELVGTVLNVSERSCLLKAGLFFNENGGSRFLSFLGWWGKKVSAVLEQGLEMVESTHLPPICPGFDPELGVICMYVNIVGSLLCCDRSFFFSGTPVSPCQQKPTVDLN